MPLSTASNIISQYKQSHKCFPKPRGDPHRIFDKMKIANFLDNYISQPGNSNITLEEMKDAIWNNRIKLLNPKCEHPPSISWICKVLAESLFDSKKITLKYA